MKNKNKYNKIQYTLSIYYDNIGFNITEKTR